MPSRVIFHEIIYKQIIRNCINISLVRVISLQDMVFLVPYEIFTLKYSQADLAKDRTALSWTSIPQRLTCMLFEARSSVAMFVRVGVRCWSTTQCFPSRRIYIVICYILLCVCVVYLLDNGKQLLHNYVRFCLY
jgi:hypothetical protein